MAPIAVLIAAAWQEQLQEYHDRVPELLDKAGIPTFEKMPELTLLGDIALRSEEHTSAPVTSASRMPSSA